MVCIIPVSYTHLLHVFEGLGRVKTNEVSSGDICALVGIDGFEIGDTVCDFESPEALPPIAIEMCIRDRAEPCLMQMENWR